MAYRWPLEPHGITRWIYGAWTVTTLLKLTVLVVWACDTQAGMGGLFDTGDTAVGHGYDGGAAKGVGPPVLIYDRHLQSGWSLERQRVADAHGRSNPELNAFGVDWEGGGSFLWYLLIRSILTRRIPCPYDIEDKSPLEYQALVTRYAGMLYCADVFHTSQQQPGLLQRLQPPLRGQWVGVYCKCPMKVAIRMGFWLIHLKLLHQAYYARTQLCVKENEWHELLPEGLWTVRNTAPYTLAFFQSEGLLGWNPRLSELSVNCL